MKICYISRANPLDKRSWSGTLFSMYEALSKENEVEWCGPIRPVFELSILKFRNIIYTKILKKRYLSKHTVLYSKAAGRFLSDFINTKNFDLIFAFGSPEIAFIETNVPIVYLTDAVFAGMLDYYNYFTNLPRRLIKDGNLIEQMALNKSNAVVFSSDWARRDAVKYYNFDIKKGYVVKFGANLLRIPSHKDLCLEKRSVLRLLFLGVDWERKGGDLAFDAFEYIQSQGISVELTIIGCNPDMDNPNVKIIPFINKNRDSEFEHLYNIMLNSDFMILPTRAECSAIVNCESCAFGLPMISTDTGGQGDYIKNDESGYLLPLEAKGEDYGKKIIEFYQDEKKFKHLRIGSREKYDRELNWSSWLKGLNQIFIDLLKR